MMQVLLDTSYLYGIMASPGKLSGFERRVLSSTNVTFHVSAVSIWEMRIKYHARHPSGHRKSRFPPVDVLGVLEGQDMEFLHLSVNHAASTLRIPLDHRDPFDELLLVQAQEEGLRLLTADRMLVRHPLAVRVEELEA